MKKEKKNKLKVASQSGTGLAPGFTPLPTPPAAEQKGTAESEGKQETKEPEDESYYNLAETLSMLRVSPETLEEIAYIRTSSAPARAQRPPPYHLGHIYGSRPDFGCSEAPQGLVS